MPLEREILAPAIFKETIGQLQREPTRYRAVARAGKTVDFHLSARRNVASAKAFFTKAVKSQGAPQAITLDGYAALHRAVREMKVEGLLPEDTKVRSSKYLNNLIEQEHGAIKQRTGPMLGFMRFKTASVTIACIDLLHRICQRQVRPGSYWIPRPSCAYSLERSAWSLNSLIDP